MSNNGDVMVLVEALEIYATCVGCGFMSFDVLVGSKCPNCVDVQADSVLLRDHSDGTRG